MDTDPAGTVAHDLYLDPERILKEAVASACGDATTPVSAEVVSGEPGAVLVRESRTADLLVVSHRGTGGFASFTAICRPDWPHGVRAGDVAEAPLPYNEKRLVWNETKGVRERTAACDKPKGKQSMN